MVSIKYLPRRRAIIIIYIHDVRYDLETPQFNNHSRMDSLTSQKFMGGTRMMDICKLYMFIFCENINIPLVGRYVILLRFYYYLATTLLRLLSIRNIAIFIGFMHRMEQNLMGIISLN